MADAGGLNPEFEKRLNALIAASGGKLTVTSGYRSVEQQTRLWNAAVKKYGSEAAARKWVAPPGKSNHNKGLAADLKGDLTWAHANAARFGLVFGMPWESWHIELPGARGAKDGHTDPPDTQGPGSPDGLASLEKPDSWGTMEGQLANLMAAITTPTTQPTQVF